MEGAPVICEGRADGEPERTTDGGADGTEVAGLEYVGRDVNCCGAADGPLVNGVMLGTLVTGVSPLDVGMLSGPNNVLQMASASSSSSLKRKAILSAL